MRSKPRCISSIRHSLSLIFLLFVGFFAVFGSDVLCSSLCEGISKRNNKHQAEKSEKNFARKTRSMDTIELDF